MSAAERPLAAPSARTWFHMAAAFGTGALLALPAPGALLLALSGGPAVVAAVLLFVGVPTAAFAVLGRVFRGRRGWWLGATTLPWAAAIVAFWLVGLDSSDPLVWTLLVVAGAGTAAAACALVSWRGPTRAAGIVMLAVILLTVLVTLLR